MNRMNRAIKAAFIAACGLAAMAGGGERPLSQAPQTAENAQSTPKTVTVATGRHSPASSIYVVRGRVRYEDVEGDAFLEMWSALPDGRRYFSRALAPAGPMGKITGTSDWRAFELPFNLMDARPAHVDLEINVVMPGKGLIEVSPITVADMADPMRRPAGNDGFGAPPPAAGSAGGWFTESDAGWWGRLLGGTLGILGGLFGALCGFLIPRGKGRSGVMGGMVVGMVVGGMLSAVGLVALGLGQPWYVWYMFLLPGGLLLILFANGLRMAKRGYAHVELRKMRARDA